MSTEKLIHSKEAALKQQFQLEEPAFEQLFRGNFASGCSFCRTRFGFDNEVAKEIVHVAFIKLWENRQRLSTSITLRSYLFRTIINASLDVIKQEKTRKQYSKFFLEKMTESFEEPGMENADYKQLSAKIKTAISQLPEQMRIIFELSRFEGLKYSAIAARLGISIKTIETQMSRALVKLREKLGPYLLLLVLTIILLKFF